MSEVVRSGSIIMFHLSIHHTVWCNISGEAAKTPKSSSSRANPQDECLHAGNQPNTEQHVNILGDVLFTKKPICIITTRGSHWKEPPLSAFKLPIINNTEEKINLLDKVPYVDHSGVLYCLCMSLRAHTNPLPSSPLPLPPPPPPPFPPPPPPPHSSQGNHHFWEQSFNTSRTINHKGTNRWLPWSKLK